MTTTKTDKTYYYVHFYFDRSGDFERRFDDYQSAFDFWCKTRQLFLYGSESDYLTDGKFWAEYSNGTSKTFESFN